MHVLRHATAALLSAALMVSVVAAPVGAQAEPPSQDNDTIVITGHGWGHGRGMSQYGSLGYAIDFDWSSEQILDHYYGETVGGTVGNSIITVRIESASDQPTVAAVDSGAMVLLDSEGAVTHIGLGGAIRLTSTENGFVVADARSCAGPFVDRPGTLDVETVRISTASTQWAEEPAVPGPGTVVAGDWDGDGDDDIGVVNGGTWKLWYFDPAGPGVVPDHSFTFGAGAEHVLVGDWNGDGVDTPATYDAGTWVLRDGLGASSGTTSATFGSAGNTPLVGDWDGDGVDDIGVWAARTWSLSTSRGANAAEINFNYGRVADAPIVGDWNGDGTADFGVIRGSDWLRRIRSIPTNTNLPRITFSTAAEAVIGDWEGTGVTNIASYDGTTVDRTGALTGFAPRTGPDVDLDETIQRCESATEQRFYRGELRAVHNNGNPRTVNALPVESYLRAVVPLEMPASWANLGDGFGAEALEVQAVSARSYALAENRTSYARTCDTISCQVYGGRAVRRNGSVISNENPLSDQALLDTAGQVRMRDGEVARTEFSSSTGGWTAGGVFPAVEDLGDAVAINPNHDWTAVFGVDEIEARWSGRELSRIEVTERNGLGQDGGRVEEVTLTFGDEVFTMSGNDFRRAFGLKSDWFTVDWEPNVRRLDCVCPRDWPDHGLDEWFTDTIE